MEHVGYEMPDLEAVKVEAARALADLAKEALPSTERRELTKRCATIKTWQSYAPSLWLKLAIFSHSRSREGPRSRTSRAAAIDEQRTGR